MTNVMIQYCPILGCTSWQFPIIFYDRSTPPVKGRSNLKSKIVSRKVKIKKKRFKPKFQTND